MGSTAQAQARAVAVLGASDLAALWARSAEELRAAGSRSLLALADHDEAEATAFALSHGHRPLVPVLLSYVLGFVNRQRTTC